MTGFLLIFQFDCFGIALFWWSFNSVGWQSHPGNSCSILYSSKFHWLIVLESKTLKPPPSDGHLIDCVITTRCRNWGRPNITRAIIRRQQCRILFTKYHSGNVLVVLWQSSGNILVMVRTWTQWVVSGYHIPGWLNITRAVRKRQQQCHKFVHLLIFW